MEHSPRIISWNVTGVCNLRCAHCYMDAGRRWPDELTTNEGLRLIDNLAAAGTELLILTGGEPLLRKDLLGLAAHAAAMGIKVVLGTTGTSITRPVARSLRENGVVAAGISIDSLDPTAHDTFRGVPGAWQKAVSGIDACRDEGLDVLIHTTALRINRHKIPDIARFAHSKGARAFHVFFLVCTGRGERLTDLSPTEYTELLSDLIDLQDSYRDMMVRARCAPYIRRMAQERGSVLAWSAGCLAGASYCRISPSGDVAPCPYLPLTAGNVRAQSFREIWESSPLLASFRKPGLKLGGKCGRCALSAGDGPDCVGCRARAFALTGDVLGEDPWCPYTTGAERGAVVSRADHNIEGRRQINISVDVAWTKEAQERLSRVPFFVRGRVRHAAEAFALQAGHSEVTPDVLDRLHKRMYHSPPKPES